MSGSENQVLAIVVGGGPAPGINGVISAATIEARNHGWGVVGCLDGFQWLAQGDDQHFRPLEISDVSRIDQRGGSILRTARANPTKDPQQMANVVRVLEGKGVTHLITIGGDDTAYTSSRVEEFAEGRLKTAHVPKTIDNDLPLPESVPTFGYETARSVGVEIVQNLNEDARTTGRWYFVVAMGRTAGHLALGIGKAAAATLTLIPEEFGSESAEISVTQVADILESSILKRLASGKNYGVAILAEGLASQMREDDLSKFGKLEHDEHGHIRLGEIELGGVFKDAVSKRLKARGRKMTIVTKNLGYELRCADPIPFDAAYTRDLGYAAVKFLREGGSGALISVVGGALTPIPFKQILDPETHRTSVRRVNVHSESYEVSRRYMIRLDASDIAVPEKLGRLASAAGTSTEEFRKQFGYLVEPAATGG
ncbi:MAG: 6-phosphofructokinase [Planctomycetaceae bacterium]|nr:6-phosphofructokinase [Planctomycetaceae bacterium]